MRTLKKSLVSDVREGAEFGRLTVLRPAFKKNADGRDLWCCRCLCGIEKDITAKALASGRSTSCGCLFRENTNSPETNAKRAASNKGKRRSDDVRKKFGERQRGKPKTHPSSRKGPSHSSAKIYRFRSPNNVVFTIKNLNHFVRENPGLFAAEDIIWRCAPERPATTFCNATSGLRSLFTAGLSHRGSWKGWTSLSRVETERNYGVDLLDRTSELPKDHDNV